MQNPLKVIFLGSGVMGTEAGRVLDLLVSEGVIQYAENDDYDIMIVAFC